MSATPWYEEKINWQVSGVCARQSNVLKSFDREIWELLKPQYVIRKLYAKWRCTEHAVCDSSPISWSAHCKMWPSSVITLVLIHDIGLILVGPWYFIEASIAYAMGGLKKHIQMRLSQVWPVYFVRVLLLQTEYSGRTKQLWSKAVWDWITQDYLPKQSRVSWNRFAISLRQELEHILYSDNCTRTS